MVETLSDCLIRGAHPPTEDGEEEVGVHPLTAHKPQTSKVTAAMVRLGGESPVPRSVGRHSQTGLASCIVTSHSLFAAPLPGAQLPGENNPLKHLRNDGEKQGAR